jgi:hypothetical protein
VNESHEVISITLLTPVDEFTTELNHIFYSSDPVGQISLVAAGALRQAVYLPGRESFPEASKDSKAHPNFFWWEIQTRKHAGITSSRNKWFSPKKVRRTS